MQPNVFVIGSARCGTTSLVRWLSQHPDISVGGIKEPKYHGRSWLPRDFDGQGDKYVFDEIVKTEKNYRALYQEVNERFRLDGSSDSLFFYENSIPSIKATCENPFIIICLRKNADRAWSAYMSLVRDGRESLSFEDALEASFNGKRRTFDWMWDIYHGSIYKPGLEAFLKTFPNVYVLLFDDIVNNPQLVIDEVCRFLGLEDSVPIDSEARASVSGRPKNRFVKIMLSRDSWILVWLRRLLKHGFMRKPLDYLVSLCVEKNECPAIRNKLIRKKFEEDWRSCRDLIRR